MGSGCWLHAELQCACAATFAVVLDGAGVFDGSMDI
jgi:hypothetical protein